MKSTISGQIWNKIQNIAEQGKGLIGNIPNQIKSNLSPQKLGGALNQVQKSINPANIKPFIQQRVLGGAFPIASKGDGTVIFSDGSIRDTSQSLKYKQQLNTLRENVLQKYAFTPQAQEYLRSLPLTVGVASAQGLSNGSMVAGTYFPSHPAERVNRSYMPGYGPKMNPARIGINPQVLGWKGNTPSQVMLHEMLHSLDANVNEHLPASFYPRGRNSGDSGNFYTELQSNQSKKVGREIESFLDRYPKRNPYVHDVESFAQYGANRGQSTLLGPQAKSYSSIFVPVSKMPAKQVSKYQNYFDTAINKLFPNIR